MLHNRICDYFGSARHVPKAMLKKHIKDNDNGIPLSFIKIADTRMGVKTIALLRLLGSRDPRAATTDSNGFRKLNVWR